MKERMVAGAWLVAALAALAGCGGGEEEPAEGYDPELLASYRAAIPRDEVMLAASPEGTEVAEGGLRQALVGEQAIFPMGAKPVVQGVNGAVRGIIQTMRTIVDTPPTFYNSETQEFVWGPWPNGDGAGSVAAYIKDHGPESGEDFRYGYALLRLEGQDLATATPVIWGGANPDPEREDYGSGVTLWDFEASAAFEEAHNPGHGPLDRGRFAAVYAREDDPNGARVTSVVAAFRGFVPQDRAGEAPSDLDYFFGEVQGEDHIFHFLNYQGTLDVVGPDGEPPQGQTAQEELDVFMAFLDEGMGRAEIRGRGGDLANDPDVAWVGVIECWDEAALETYLAFGTFNAQDERLGGQEEGAVTDCGPVFQATLDELNVPSLDDVDGGLRAALSEVATNGISGE